MKYVRAIQLVCVLILAVHNIACVPKKLTPDQIAEQEFKKAQYATLVGLMGNIHLPGYEGNDFRASGVIMQTRSGKKVIVTAGRYFFGHTTSITGMLRKPHKSGNRSKFETPGIPLEVRKIAKQKNDNSDLVILEPARGYEHALDEAEAIEICEEERLVGEPLWFFHFAMKPEQTVIEKKYAYVFQVDSRFGLGDVGAALITQDGKLAGFATKKDRQYYYKVYVEPPPHEIPEY